jgi:predicted nucleotidyltransferase
MERIQPLIDLIVPRLAAVGGVKAIVLGGSWASGTQRDDSDVDFGLYYDPAEPLDIPALRAIAEELNDTPNPVVTEPGGWGRWMNGGAWLTIGGQRVDFIYRDSTRVAAVIAESLQGNAEFHYYQQPPYGFRSHTYLAEVRFARVLHDPAGAFARLSTSFSGYPPALRASVVQGLLGDSDFSLLIARKLAHRGDVLLVAGCLTHLVMNYIQVLYAVNETLFMGEKKLYADAPSFAVKPDDLVAKLNRLVQPVGSSAGELTETVAHAAAFFDELVSLASAVDLPYQPRRF